MMHNVVAVVVVPVSFRIVDLGIDGEIKRMRKGTVAPPAARPKVAPPAARPKLANIMKQCRHSSELNDMLMGPRGSAAMLRDHFGYEVVS